MKNSGWKHLRNNIFHLRVNFAYCSEQKLFTTSCRSPDVNPVHFASYFDSSSKVHSPII